jgi:signal transduction histidine kinase
VKRAPRIGWVREVSILLPLVPLLLVLVSTVTLLSYRDAIDELRDAFPTAADDAGSELARQSLVVQRLTWVVVPVNVALTLLVLLYLRHLVRPVETLLERARGVAEPVGTRGDDVEFLVDTFERAIATLAHGGDEPDAQEIAALQRALGSSLDSGVLLVDNAGRVLAVNRVATDLLGLPAPVDDNPPLETYGAAHPELVAILRRAVDQGEGVRRRELDLAPQLGQTLTLGLTAHTLRRDDGSIRGVLALFVDLTQARRRADEERRASSLAQLGRLSAGLAHELRNSLAALRGYLTLIERGPDEDSITDYLGEIRSESDQLQRVLEDFLSFARPEARLETLAVSDLAAHAAADPGLGVAVRVDDRTGGELRIRADRQLLERALRNLLRNAAEAQAEAGGREPIELGVARDAAALTLVVADRGPGVPPERLEELFEPFATTRANGVGLGLPMAQRILELHGGQLRLEPRAGGGTRAVVTLPSGIIVT